MRGGPESLRRLVCVCIAEQGASASFIFEKQGDARSIGDGRIKVRSNRIKVSAQLVMDVSTPVPLSGFEFLPIYIRQTRLRSDSPRRLMPCGPQFLEFCRCRA